MAENLNNLLTVHHFLYKAFGLAYCALLAHKVLCRAAADLFDNACHYRHAKHYDNRKPQAVIEHYKKYGGNHNGRHKHLGKALGNHLAEGVYIVGVAAHYIAVMICVKIFYGQNLHFVKHFNTHFFERSLCDYRHKLVKEKTGNKREHIKADKGGDCRCDLGFCRCPVARRAVGFHNGDDLLHKHRGNGAYNCAEKHADKRYGEQDGIELKHCFNKS